MARKSSHNGRCSCSQRSMLVFITTVMNMENGRCEMTFLLLSSYNIALITQNNVAYHKKIISGIALKLQYFL